MKLLLTDVDFTLYPKGTGPFAEVNLKIEEYVMQQLGISREQARHLRKEYIGSFGSTLGGMMHNHGVDPHDFLKTVHDVPVEEMLKEDDRLKEALSEVSIPMVAFSNGSREYVGRILNALGVESYFTDIFAIEDMEFIPKPLSNPFELVVEKYGFSPFELILADDRADNIETAFMLGIHGILVGYDADSNAEIVIPDIYQLPDAVDRLISQYLKGDCR
jgi:putative hydrolase of the HAD superfamily